jgi:polar amino acid transport system permease protein
MLKGLLMTVGLTVGASCVCVLVAGILLWMQRSDWSGWVVLAKGIVVVVRGTPLLVQLLIGYYVVANAMGVNNAWLVGMGLLGFFEGAYLSEILRAAIESVSAKQLEAAKALGFTQWQSQRWIVLPQAFKRALPGMTGQLVNLLKDSTLLSVIGVEELMQVTRQVNAAGYTALEGYIPLALAYLILTLPMIYWTDRLEKQYHYEH